MRAVKVGVWNVLGAVAALWSALFFTGLAHAQSANTPITIGSPPPVHSAVDANGVNLLTGALTLSTQDVSIGSAGAEALSYLRTFIGQGSVTSAGWTDNVTGTVSTIYGTTVSIGSVSEKFYTQNNVFLPQSGGGSNLVYNSAAGTYTYTTGAGVAYVFSTALSSNGVYPTYVVGRITSINSPDGHQTTFTYQTACVYINGNCLAGSRLQSVNNNAGYQLKLTYVSDSAPVTVSDFAGPWSIIKTVTGINNATDYCSPSANSCSGYSTTWPTVTYLTTAGPPFSTTTTDTLGRVTTYNYDASYRITKIVRPAGETTTIVYNSSGQVQSVSNGIGTWSYAYVTNANGSTTTTVTDPLGHTRVAVGAVGPTFPNAPTIVEPTGQFASDTDGLGRATNFVYDNYQRPTTITQPAGDKIQYVYDSRANITQVTHVPTPGSPLANIVVSAAYDAICNFPAKCNQPNSTLSEIGAQTDYTYDPTTGLTLTTTSPAPIAGATRPQKRLSYTPLYAWYKNSVGTITQAATPIIELTSTSSCQTLATCAGTSDELKSAIVYGVPSAANNLAPTSISTGSGDGVLVATTTTTYDTVGNRLTTVSPLSANQTVRNRYDLAGQIVGVVGPDPDGAGPLNNPAVRYTYDLDGRATLVETGTVLSQSDSDWANFTSLTQRATVYDSAERTVKTSLAGSGTTWNVSQFTYDNANNLTCSAVRMNPALYGSLPNSACTLGANGSGPADMITFNGYDAANELTQVTIGYGTAAQANYATTTYTPNGLVKTIADANNNLTTNLYDGFDRVSQVNYPSPTKGSNASNVSDYEAYTYQADGNVVSDRRRDGTSIAYSYDALGRLILKHFPPSTETDVYYGYDLLGRSLYANFGSASGPGVSSTWDALGRRTSTTNAGKTLSYAYDLAGNRTRVTWPDTGANALFVTYVYDNLNRVTAVEENGATSGVGLLATYTYDAMGQRASESRAGGAGATTTAHDDAAGRLSTFAHNFTSTGNNVSWTFGYTPANQLVSSSASNDAYSYHPGAVTNAYAPNGLNQYASVNGASYTYETRGNLSVYGNKSLVFDIENRLASASSPTTLTLTYDPVQRLQSTATTSATTNFLYDDANLAGEYDGAGNILRRYVFDPNTDEPVAWYEGAGTADRRWLHADRQGSVIAWSTSTGALGAARGYGPYGEPAAWSGSRFAYTGQIMIPELQLYYYNARVYDPAVGSFLQTDPTGYKSDVNAYAYTNGDPVNGTDPSGLGDNPDDPIIVNGTRYNTPSEMQYLARFFSGGANVSNAGAAFVIALANRLAAAEKSALKPRHRYTVRGRLTRPGTDCSVTQVSGATNRNIVPGNYGNHQNNRNYRVVLLGHVDIGSIRFRTNPAGTWFQNNTNTDHVLRFGDVTTIITGNMADGYSATIVGEGDNLNWAVAEANQYLGPDQFEFQLEEAAQELVQMCGG